MTAILPLLFKAGPWILGALGIAFGLFRHQQAKTATAQANEAKAQAGQQIAAQQVAETQANADAQKAGSDAAKARTDIDNDVAAKPANEVKSELQNWTRS